MPYKKIVKVIQILSLTLFLIFSFVKSPFPEKNSIDEHILNTEPNQEETKKESFDVSIDDYTYTIHPQFSYELYGVVVTYYDSSSLFDLAHKEDPGNIKDLCVVWGKNVNSESYKEVTYKSGQFTCYVKWSRQLAEPFDIYQLSNNHLIPKNDEVRKVIQSAQRGDQVHIKGYLVDYAVSKNGQTIYTRGTSTTRNDTGGHACETVYVEEAEVIKRNAYNFEDYKKISFAVFVVLTSLSILKFFVK